MFLACEGLAVWEVVGRAMVVTRQEESSGGPEAGADGNVKGNGLINDENTLVGVIARSAGVWDNDKTVCSCTGRTLWQEREEEVGRGML